VARQRERRDRVKVRGGRVRLGVFAAVFSFLCFNALAFWGVDTAKRLETVVQACIGVGAVVFGSSNSTAV
jgi:hypothetical protein